MKKSHFDLPHSTQSLCSAVGWKNCLAKSCPAKTVRQHARECSAIYRALIEMLRIPGILLPPNTSFFAFAHDCGKISPGFLWEISPEMAKKYAVPPAICNPRHEIISEAAVKAYLGEKCSYPGGSIVGWHHGRHVALGLPEGACDYGGATWQHERVGFLQWVNRIVGNPPSELSNAGQLLAAGLLCIADWIASDAKNFLCCNETTTETQLFQEAERILRRIGWSFPDFPANQTFSDIFPFSPNEIQKAMAEYVTEPGIYLLESAMGSGKTEAALYAAYRLISTKQNRGIYFALPTRLTSNRIHERLEMFLKKFGKDQNLRLIHGTSWLEATGAGEMASGESWFAPNKRALLAPFGVGTVDQLLKGVLNIKHFFVRLAGLAGKVVIIDEVHSYDPYMHALLVKACHILRELNCTVILLSATLTESRAKTFFEGTNLPSSYYPQLSFANSTNNSCIALPASSTRIVKVKGITAQDSVKKIISSALNGCNVALILNTVADAQKWFSSIREQLPESEVKIGLLHSRFPLWRRNEIEREWLTQLGKDDSRRPSGSILVSTQIIEQSVDIDFDLMFSELAPSDLLFQRIGRLWRHHRSRRPLPEAHFYWIDRQCNAALTPEEFRKLAGGSSKVYAPFLLYRAEKLWRKISVLNLPDDMREMLEFNTCPPDREDALEATLYDEMMQDAEQKINRANVNAQLSLDNEISLQADDGDEAPTRLTDIATRQILLLRSWKICGKELQLLLSDGSPVKLYLGTPFQLEIMREFANNLVSIPAWQIQSCEYPLPEMLKSYWKYQVPVPVIITLDGQLTLPDETMVDLHYDDWDGMVYQKAQKQENYETLSADW